MKLSTQHIRLRSPHWILRRIYSSPTSIKSSRGYLQENVATISAVGFAGLRRRTHSMYPIVCIAHLGALQFKRHRARACRRTRTLRSQAFFVDSLDFFRCRGVLEVRPIPYKPRNPSANSTSIWASASRSATEVVFPCAASFRCSQRANVNSTIRVATIRPHVVPDRFRVRCRR